MNLSMLLSMVPAEKLAAMVKPHVPQMLESAHEALAKAGGSDAPGTAGVLLFRSEGRTMASVYTLDAWFAPKELVGTIDVAEAIDGLDVAQLLK